MEPHENAPARRGTPEQGICNILKTALGLFREKGFAGTGIRQLARQAGVSLGLMNHYFGSKEHLGAQCLRAIDSYAAGQVPDAVSFAQNPILYDLVEVQVLFHYVWGNYRQFYLDSLELDFFFKYLSIRPPILIEELKKHYPIEAGEDEILLYSRYMPYMLEKTLMLKKEQGLFQSIPYEQVPFLICHAAMSPFIPAGDVKKQEGEARRIAEAILSGLEKAVPIPSIEEFARRFAEDKKTRQVL